MREQQLDVAIVGAGMAGSALALALAKSDLDVALIDARPLAGSWPDSRLEGLTVADYGARVCALNAASREWLTSLGVWTDIAERRACGYRRMSVWDGAGTGRIEFDADAVGAESLGHIVENRLTEAALQLRLADTGVRTLHPVRVETLERRAEGVHLLLEDGRQLSTRLLVGADGARSRVRAWSGLPVRSWDYGHSALVATVACEQRHENTAWQRFTPEGPLAFLPLAGGDERFCSIVWSAPPERVQDLLALDDEAFCHQLGRAFEHRLGAVVAVSERQAIPLHQRHATDYVQPGLALVGDAAHTIHPLAGQGVNMGLLDSQVLAEELLRGRRRGLQPGDRAVLDRYQRRRKGHNLLMMAAMEGFKRLFESRRPAVLMARNLGLHALQSQEALKRPLIRAALGQL